MNYCFDIDGTLCSNTEGHYDKATPFLENIARVNSYFEQGHRIILYTARGSTTGIDWRELTEKQLAEWGLKYHELYFGKPTADVYIDDKAINLNNWRSQPDRQGDNNNPGIELSSRSTMEKSSYLEVTYAPEIAPPSNYPNLLANWIRNNVYEGTGSLLDLGCGTCEHLKAFNKLGFEVVGVDLSPVSLKSAGQLNVKITNIETEPLPFPPNSFDFVFSKSVIEHLRNPSRLMENALEVLRPGGTAVFMTPSWAHSYWGPFYVDHTHVTPFTALSLDSALQIAGFVSVEALHFYQLPFLWKFSFLKPLVKILAALPLPYRPYRPAPWPESINKLIRFSTEVMLLGIGKKKG